MFKVGKPWVLIFAGIALVALASPADAFGARETADRGVSAFDKVILSTNGNLTVTEGERESLQITARAADLADLVTEVRDGTLVIAWRDHEPAFSIQPPEFHITMRTVAGLQTTSSGSIAAANLRSDSLQVRISSSGSISIASLAADSLNVRISSSGSFSAAGRVRQQSIVISSSGDCRTGGLASATADIRASSSGRATLRVSDSLRASVTSSGSVRYFGNPHVDATVTSSGRLVDLGG